MDAPANSQLEGRKFRRQHSVGRYIIDFYCPAEKLAVELDGAGHFTEEGTVYDDNRTMYLNRKGIRVIRFENDTVFKFLDHLLEEIKRNFGRDGVKGSDENLHQPPRPAATPP